MSDIEFDILDELYFVKTFAELLELFPSKEIQLEEQLWGMIEKQWIKILEKEEDKEIEIERHVFMLQKTKFRFNATKKGLLAHNQV